MSLSNSRVEPTIAVSDMGSATQFTRASAASGGEDQPDGGRTYPCGEGSRIHVYLARQRRDVSGATLAGWLVADVGQTVDELSAKGVTFEQYGEPFNTNEKGIAKLGDIEIA